MQAGCCEAHLIYDLHAHSNASDGNLSPEALVARAVERGVQVLALTDHDTTGALARASLAAAESGLVLIPGIEFSTQWMGRGIHVVGLNIDPTHPVLQAGIASQLELRYQRAEQIAHKLSKMNVKDSLVGAQQLAGDAVIGRPHFAQYLLNAGYAPHFAGAFKKYLGAGKPGDVKQCWPEMATVIGWITAAGGIAVLAHPDKYEMTRTKLCTLVQAFREAGGRALEVVSGKQLPGVAEKLAAIANQFGLLASCGSDFHVPNQPWQELGAFGKLPSSCEPVWHAWQ